MEKDSPSIEIVVDLDRIIEQSWLAASLLHICIVLCCDSKCNL
jgi:hypothetical protein